MKFSAEELNIIRRADAIIAGKITTTDFITGADAARSLLRFRLAAEPRESFCAFFLNCHNGVIAFEELFKGNYQQRHRSSAYRPATRPAS